MLLQAEFEKLKHGLEVENKLLKEQIAVGMCVAPITAASCSLIHHSPDAGAAAAAEPDGVRHRQQAGVYLIAVWRRGE